MIRRVGAPSLAFLAYAAVTAAFHASILPNLARGVIGEVWDNELYLWDAWWIRDSLLHGRNPFFSSMVFAPEGTPLVLHSLIPIPAAAIALLESFLPVELAYNLIVLLAFPIAGVAAYLLCRRFTRDHLSAWCGGLAFMLSPFLVSKSVAGWVHLLYAGGLPLFFLILLRATDPDAPRRTSIHLAAMTFLALFTSEMVTVFAANVAVFTLGWRLWTAGDRSRTLRQLTRAVLPSVVVCVPYFAMVFYYIVAYDLPLNAPRRLSYSPDLVSYFLPFNVTSIYSGRLLGSALAIVPPALPLGGLPPLARADLACYLGLLVAPLSLAGLFLARRQREARFCLLLFVTFLILSIGPALLINREVVSVMGWPLRLPFALWERIPGLGAVAQSGRYLIVSYMALAVGLACFMAAVRARLHGPRTWLLALAVAVVVCLDYGFRTWVSPLPGTPTVSAQHGSVLDPRLKNGEPMYYQTKHGRPLVGGYLSRTPPRPLERYRNSPGMSCLFLGNKTADCSRAAIMAGLRQLDVRDVMLSSSDWRNDVLKQFGFLMLYRDERTIVWSVPAL